VGSSFLLRLLFAVILVAATYNPEGLSYYHWVFAEGLVFGPEQAVVGVILLIGWVVYLRATFRSLGALGLTLSLAFCGSLVWLFSTWGWISPKSPRAIAYINLTVIAFILAIGMSWSHVRRRLSGQVDVDDVDEND
jgi:hypothetical protein